MAYSETTGFQGLSLDLIEKRLLQFDPETSGFSGLFFDLIEKRILQKDVEKLGFNGLIFSIQESDRFIKISDFRGNPIAGASVKVKNIAGDQDYTTDSNGFCMIFPDTTGTKTIEIQKNKTSKSVSYTYASERLSKTVILQPPLM